MLLPQIYQHSVIIGGDAIFHMNRFYDAAMQIKTGHYNYFLSNFGFQQSARIVNALYSPVIAYIAGLILLIANSWLKFELITSFFIFIISGLSMYLLATKIHLSKTYALIISLLYITTTSVSWWSVSQSFTSWGSAIMPLLLLCGIKMISNKKHPINVLFLALITSLLIQTHILSSLIGVSALIPFVVAGFIQSNIKKSFVINLLKSVLLVIALTANIWGGMLEIFGSNKLVPTAPLVMTNNTNNFGSGMANFNNLGLVFSLLFIFQIVLTLLNWKKLTLTEKVINGTGGFYLILSSGLIPWSILSRLFPSLSTYLQFPQRLTVIANILLLLGLGINLTKKELPQKLGTPILITLTILAGFDVNTNLNNVSNIWHGNQVVAVQSNTQVHSKDPNIVRTSFQKHNDLVNGLKMVEKPTSDYLPIVNQPKSITFEQLNPYYQYSQQIINNKTNIHKTVTKNGDLKLSWFNHNNSNHDIQLSVIKYKHTCLRLNGNSLSKNFKTTAIGALIINSKPGANTLILNYKAGSLFHILSIICLISWLLLIIRIMFHHRKKAQYYPTKNE